MNKFKYRVYYKYLGPSAEDPFATKPLSSDQVAHCLDGLRIILPSYFSSTGKDDSLYITAVTTATQLETDAVLERFVVNANRATSGLSLLIDKLSGGEVSCNG